MANKAIVKLTWKKSVSTDIVKQTLKLNVGGTEISTDLPVNQEENTIEVKANQSFSFTVTATDNEGKRAESLVYSHTFGDLEDPLPPTELGHTVVQVVPDV